MRNRLPRLTCGVLLLATAFSGGCVSLCHAPPDAIPVRRLPDEVLHNCNCLALPQSAEIVSTKAERKVVPADASAPAEVPAAGCGSCAVFYTGGALGSGQYPLKGELRVTEAIAVARGPIQPSCGKSSASRVTILRRLLSGQQIPIRVDLNEALRDPRENIPIWPNDMILTSETCCETFGRIFHCSPKSTTNTVTIGMTP